MKKIFLVLIYCCLLAVGAVERAFSQSTCTCDCLRPLFQYLISSGSLFTYTANGNKIFVSTLINNARNAGYEIPSVGCDILAKNSAGYFYALTTATTGKEYKAQFGNCSVVLKANGDTAINFLNLSTASCRSDGQIYFNAGPAQVTKRFQVTRSANVAAVYSHSPIYPDIAVGYYAAEYNNDALKIGWNTKYGTTLAGGIYTTATLSLDSVVNIPSAANIESAKLHLFAYPLGFAQPNFPNAHTPFLNYAGNTVGIWYLENAWSQANGAGDLWAHTISSTLQVLAPTTANQDVVVDVRDIFQVGVRKMDYGIQLRVNLPPSRVYKFDTVMIYQTYCSEKYDDVSRRPYMDVTWSTATDTNKIARLYVDSCFTCAVDTAKSCYSAITDTSVNPFLYGLKGNWRPLRAYTYYGPRNESDPTSARSIRTSGTLQNFSSFWQLKDGVWVSQDTTASKWVWNSETTLFNEKGAEMENKDPLGRYNAGLFGYGNALATAVAINARYREIAFEGFEDYNFSYGGCVGCKPSRNFDFSSYYSNFDTTEQHTGRYSLRVDANKTAGISAVVAAEKDTFHLDINTTSNSCNTTGDKVLTGVKAGTDALLPAFSPVAGKKMLVSVWVKESGQRNNGTYSGSKVTVNISRTGALDTAITAIPGGNIIEGWQRYEMVVAVPANATAFTIYLQNTGSNTVYFDDLRVHPYNANMRSFVYDEVSMRLMAELDENNYAAFYEYEDDGSLVRVKKETERGIMTIKESRSGLLDK